MKDALLALVLMLVFVGVIGGFVWLCVVTSGIPMLIIFVAVFWSIFYGVVKDLKDPE